MWHLAVLQALLAFSVPPLSWRGRVLDVVLFGIGAISGPFCILLLPCVGIYWWFRRQRWTLAVLSILFIGVMIQLVTILRSVRSPGAPLGATPFRLLRMIGGSIFIDSMTGGGGPYLRASLLVVAALGGLTIMVWGWRSAPLAGRLFIVFTTLVLIASLRDPLLLPGATPRWEVAGECHGNPLLVPALADVSLDSSMVCMERRNPVGSFCGAGGSASYPGRSL